MGMIVLREESQTQPLAVGTAATRTLAMEALADCQLDLSAPSRCDLMIYRGDSGAFRVTVTDLDGNPVDVSAGTWDVDIRQSADSEPPLGSLMVEPVPGEPSQVDVILSADQSANLSAGGPYVWDIELTLGDVVQTLIAGEVTVVADVSRAAPVV